MDLPTAGLAFFAVSFFLGLGLAPAGGYVARRLGMLRRPEGESAGQPAVPVAGGPVILVVTGLTLAVLPWCEGSSVADRTGMPGLAIGVAATVVCLVGIAADRFRLRARWLLLGQIIAVSVAVAGGLSVPFVCVFGYQIEFGPLGGLVAATGLLIATNALLVLRGMDALVSSYAAIVAGALGVMCVMNGSFGPGVLSLALAGVTLAFLVHGFPPTSVFMGHSGATTAGLLVGVVAVEGCLKAQATAALAIPVALLTLPLFDSMATVLRRSTAGAGVFAPDHLQLYHRLVRVGLSRRQILGIVCAAAVLTAAAALMSQWSNSETFAMLGAAGIIAVLLMTRLFGNVRLSGRGGTLPRTAHLLPPQEEHDAAAAQTADWPALWAGVTGCAPSLNLRHARLEVREGSPFVARWDNPSPAAGRYEIWSARFAIGPTGASVGSLELTGVRNGESEMAILGQLAERVPGFRRVAALRPVARLDDPEDTPPSIAPQAKRRRLHVLETVEVNGPAAYQAGVVRLRVCHLGKFYPPAPGGIENHVRTLAMAQARLGARVHVICVNHESTSGVDSTWKGFGATPTATERDGRVRVSRVGKVATVARLDICPALIRVLRRLMDDPPHIVHMHAPNPTMLMAYALACPSLRLVVTHHSDVIRQRLLRYALGPFRRVVYTRAQRILTTSPNYALGSAELKRYTAKVDAVPLGLDLEPFLKPSAAALDHAERLRTKYPGPLWLGVGRLTYYKGFDVALAALAHAPGTLMIIGTGPLAADLRRRAAELGVADRVVWVGYATPDELVGAYHAATAFWFSSNARSEGFGLVQVEAMASGCPVINTAIPHSGVTYVSPDGVSGLTVPVNDPAAFAAAARRLLDEPGLRERLGQEGRQRAVAEFDHTVMARRCLDIYAGLLAPPVASEKLRTPAPSEFVVA